MPEKSGMDPVLGSPLVAGPTAGAAVCPKAGIAAAAANAITKRKPRRRRLMISSSSWFAQPMLLRSPD
jgi:hypothetical protein